jgi:hypothetical protein
LFFPFPQIGDRDGKFGKWDFMFEEELDVLCPLDDEGTFCPAVLASIVYSIKTCN